MKKILQGFRNLFRRKPRYSGRAYLCDPNRNSECAKEGCWYIAKSGPCKCTMKKKFAQQDENGKPVRATDSDVVNLEWLEWQISTRRPLIEPGDR